MIMDKTESDIEQARSEGLLTKNHLTKLITKLEKQAREKLEIEEKILDLLQDQITTDKAGDHRGKILRETQENRRKLEISMSQTENQLSIRLLDLEKWRGNVQRARESVERLQKDHDDADSEANTVTDEIDKLKTFIKNKLIALDTVNKQLEQLIAETGGKGLSLNELKVIEYEKDIEELDGKVKESQAFWMRLQSMVASLTEKRSQQLNEIFLGRKREYFIKFLLQFFIN
jgi:chromosome segregation ATPase